MLRNGKQRHILVGVAGRLEMRRHAFGGERAAARRQGRIGLDQLLVNGTKRHLIGPQRRHRRLLRAHRLQRHRHHHCGHAGGAEHLLVHHEPLSCG